MSTHDVEYVNNTETEDSIYKVIMHTLGVLDEKEVNTIFHELIHYFPEIAISYLEVLMTPELEYRASKLFPGSTTSEILIMLFNAKCDCGFPGADNYVISDDMC